MVNGTFGTKLRKLVGLGQCLILCGLAFGGRAQAAEDDGATKSLMHSFVLEFAKLAPYLGSEAAMTSEKGKATVAESLKVLNSKVKTPSKKIETSPGFRITFNLLADHIEKTQSAFDRGEMDYVRMRLNGMGNLCASCHMQAPKISNYSAFEFVAARGQDVSFSNAEFLFTIRRYDEALSQYDQLIRTYPKGKLTSDQLPEVYRHKISIFARVYRSPDQAIANLNEDLKNKNLPQDVRINVESWLQALREWKKEAVDPAKLDTPKLLAFVSKNTPADLVRKIGPENPQLLTLLRMSGLLYERLYKEPASQNTQEILYQLAKLERSLAPLFWYPMNEIYLKECITKFPKKSFSQKCFDSYKQGMEERYFGRPLPEGVQQSLEALKSYL